jgi:hypothetical protein
VDGTFRLHSGFAGLFLPLKLCCALLVLQVPGSAQLAAYTTLLHQAKQFIKQRRRDILQRQEAVMAAQADWRAMLAAMEEQQQAHQAAGTAAPAELLQAVQQLRQLKVVLQDQIHQLNNETQQVKGLKARVRQAVPSAWLPAGTCCSGSVFQHSSVRSVVDVQLMMSPTRK